MTSWKKPSTPSARRLPAGWPSIAASEIPPDADDALIETLHAMNFATLRLRHLLNAYAMFRELGQRRSVARAIADGGPAAGSRTIVQTLLRDMAVGLASLFDNDGQATDVRRMINTLLHPRSYAALHAFHATWDPPLNTDSEFAKLLILKKRLNSPKIRSSIDRIRNLRHQEIAHLDLAPESPLGTPNVQEIPRVLIAAGTALVQCNRVALGRAYNSGEIWNIATRNARIFADTLVRGIDAETSSDRNSTGDVAGGP